MRTWSLLLVIITLLAACGANSTAPAQPTQMPEPTQAAQASEATQNPAASQPAATAASAGDAELTPITLAMSFIPNVQFAPYYVAAAKGFYREAGLEVSFDYNFENDVVQRVATWPDSGVAFATASGTSTLLARQQGIPVKTVMTLYQQFPIVFFAKSATGLQSADDLLGKTVGIPGNFGESLYALLALRYANNLDEAAFTVQEIGFTQAQAVLEDKVEVAIGYAMNEPLILAAQGEQVDVLRIADIYNLAANGIVVSEALLAEDPELVRRFVVASLRGLQATLENPDEAFELSLAEIPEATLGDSELQRQVLEASLPYWTSERTEAEGLGFTDGEVWVATEQFMRDAGLLAGQVNVEEAFTNAFLK